jgi:tetratricopeptide (TPR) repeat protein
MSRLPLLFLLIVLVPSTAFACLWDRDTLAQERSRFPDALELITGRFPRHSKEFYEWRARDRQERLKADPDNLSYYDDLAVAYDKTGRHQQAIDVMREADSKVPGRYETEANLGTFYIHAGRVEEGLGHIEQALRLNPDAHFGREKYQALLARYVRARTAGKAPSGPLSRTVTVDDDSGTSERVENFATFLTAESGAERLSQEEHGAALRGLLGIMRFGNHESPALLEAVGDLLGYPYAAGVEDGKQLAARAYLKASYGVTDEVAREAYRGLAKQVLRSQGRATRPEGQLSLEELEGDFRKELAEAQRWYEGVRADELAWIEQGRDVDAEFTRKYFEDPQPAAPTEPAGVSWWARLRGNLILDSLTFWVALTGTLVIASLFVLWRKYRGKMARA